MKRTFSLVISTALAGTLPVLAATAPDSGTKKAKGKISPAAVLKTGIDKSAKAFTVDHPLNRALISTFNTNTTLRAKVKEQYQIAEGVASALAGWRPAISLTSTIARNWTDTESPAGSKATTRSTTSTSGLSIKQNIFAGGETMASVQKARHNVSAGLADLASVEQKVLYSAVSAYLDLWSKRRVLALYENSVAVKEKNVTQTRARYEVGEVTLTDVSQAESDLASAIAQKIAAAADVTNAIETYIQVVGEAPADLPPPPPLGEIRVMPKSRADIESLALRHHPDIQKAEFSFKASEADVDVSTAALLPSVDLGINGQRSLQSASSGSPANRDNRSNSASIGVTVTIPIYQRGTEWAKIRSSGHAAAQSKINLSEARQTVVKNALQTLENWVSARKMTEQYKVQIEAAKASLEGVRQENAVGERTVYDVLTAENALVQAETNYLKAYQSYLLAGYAVLQSVGMLTVSELGLPVEPYPVKENYEQIGHRFAGTSSYPER